MMGTVTNCNQQIFESNSFDGKVVQSLLTEGKDILKSVRTDNRLFNELALIVEV